MSKVVITSDSTCDLGELLLNKYDIKTVPLYVNFGEDSFKDGVDIDTPTLYEYVNKYGYLPKTAATSVGDFIEFFTPYIEKGYDVFYCGISGFMSRTYQNALMAAQEFDEGRVKVIDAKNLSSGIGLLLMKAAMFRDQGMNVKDIANNVEKLVPLVRSQFLIETMDYLHKGGRCSGVAKIAATLLKLRPIIEVIDGKMEVGKKPIGTRRACDMLISMIMANYPNIDLDNIMITHAVAPESVKYLNGKLEELVPDVKNINITRAGCVISSHCGAGTIGILYIKK